MDHLGESIDKSEDCGVAPGGGQTGDKDQRDVAPWSTGHWKGFKESLLGSGRGLISGADQTGCHVLLHVVVQKWPPGSLADDVTGSLSPGMTSQQRGVRPVNDPRPQGLRDKEPSWRTTARHRELTHFAVRW